MGSTYTDFTEWLGLEMAKRNLTVNSLARRAGVAPSSISRATDPNADYPIGSTVARAIAHALNLPEELVLRKAGRLERKPPETMDRIFLEHVYRRLSAVGREKELVSYAEFLLLQLDPSTADSEAAEATEEP